MMQAPAVENGVSKARRFHAGPGSRPMPVLFDKKAIDKLSSAVYTEACANMRQMQLTEVAAVSKDGRNGSIPLPTVTIPEMSTRDIAKFKLAVHAAIEKLVTKMMGIIQENLDKFYAMIYPALVQIGDWLVSFGDKIQATLESFSTTMDRVQKIFDQLMAQFSSTSGTGEDQMIYDTFTLFDASGTGFISNQDLHDVSDMYGISALQGEKSDKLFERYDINGDGKLFKPEFTLFVRDPSIPSIMAVVLRTYSSKLSVISGNVGAARLRDEVAEAVVEYFTLVCAKNMTKVGWVSQTLTNGSLPMAFTADVLKQLAMQVDNPNKLTTQDPGEVVVAEMTRIDEDYTLEAFELMSDPDFWESEGFDPEDQPICVERVSHWIELATDSPDVMAALRHICSDDPTLRRDTPVELGSRGLVELGSRGSLHKMARITAERRKAQYLRLQRQQRAAAAVHSQHI